MRKTILFTERPVLDPRITLRNPVKSDGTYTKYAKIALVIGQNEPIAKRDIMEILDHDMTADFGLGFRAECPNRLCGMFQTLRAAKIIDYDYKSRKWTTGINYHRFVQIILDRTAKVWEGMNDEVDR